ncbi:DUF402 domain-containing protein [Saccharothrix sp. 6-C]|uniref:DUF402 domain-containing protein n=1 Tax=Saccharothrix texasensis TaxID=103734 RepID=A0A3N1H686_9PSEU|nr:MULTISPECIES: DUF402 domain-containing protein [Saccharothrix]QQQ77580.1 DUF402 domain-containing protein [Saccharothrix sp. 6-C]ROP38008.1 hypothetical protein EDD40_3343 [Saccharothrix texasensis]
MGYFQPGDVALRREVLHGKPWAVTPTRVVADGPDLLVVFTAPDTEFGFYPHPRTHHWQELGRTRWTGIGKLQLHRPGDAYSVDLYWQGGQRRFAGFYLNLQAPFRRTALGFDTLDHALDFWAPVDGDWRELDRDEFEEMVADGKYDAAEAEGIRRTAEEVGAMLTAGTTWWDPAWGSWEPDPGWPVPVLPAGWEDHPLP